MVTALRNFRIVYGSGAVFLAALFVAALALALFHPRTERVGIDDAYLMRAESVVFDRDLSIEKADLERFAARRGREPSPLDGGLGGGIVLYSIVAAPFVWLAPERGAAILNVLLIGFAVWTAARVLFNRLGAAGTALTALFVVGVPLATQLLLAGPSVLFFAAPLAGLSLIFGREPRRVERAPQIYGGEESAARRMVRWAAAGLLLALPLAAHPAYAVLPLVAVTLPPPARRRVCWAGLAAGALLGLGVGVGAESWLRGGLSFAAEWVGGRGLEPGLAGWNGLYFFFGRHTGVMLYFIPALVAFACWSRGRHSALLAATALGSAGLLLASPFDWAGTMPVPGNARFLPLYAALWFLPTRAPRRFELALGFVLAAAVVWPSWVAPWRAVAGEQGHVGQLAPYVDRWLPFETSLRNVALPRGQALGEDVILRPASVALSRTDGGWIQTARYAEFVIASREPVERVHIEMGSEVSSEIEVVGGTMEQTLFRPDGTLAIEVAPGSPRVKHSVWWDDEKYTFQNVGLRLGRRPAEPITMAIDVGGIDFGVR